MNEHTKETPEALADPNVGHSGADEEATAAAKASQREMELVLAGLSHPTD